MPWKQASGASSAVSPAQNKPVVHSIGKESVDVGLVLSCVVARFYLVIYQAVSRFLLYLLHGKL